MPDMGREEIAEKAWASCEKGERGLITDSEMNQLMGE